jgi:hypothetical protein
VGVLARWLKDTRRSEEAVFLEHAVHVWGFAPADAARFRDLCRMATRAVLKGKYVEAYDDKSRQNFVWDIVGWMRDDRLGPEEQLSTVMPYLCQKGLINRALHEKEEALRLWDEVRALFQTITFPSPELRDFVDVSIEYGARLFAIVAQAWHIMALGCLGRDSGRYAATPLARHIAAYDAAWKAYRELPARSPLCPSLYTDWYLNLPGTPPVPGIGATVDKYRAIADTQGHCCPKQSNSGQQCT